LEIIPITRLTLAKYWLAKLCSPPLEVLIEYEILLELGRGVCHDGVPIF
jgi:hypothetical protein